jgi:hypothetical protein
MMLTGFLKSTLGTSFISIGLGTIIISIYDINVPDYFVMLGIICVLVGFIIYYFGDIYNINKNEEMEFHRLDVVKKIVNNRIEEEKSNLFGLDVINYPDNYSADEILEIGLKKLKDKKKKGTKQELLDYCEILYDNNLISRTKRDQCITELYKNDKG